MDFVAIERSDERLMKQRDGLPRDLIRLFFVALDVSPPRLEIGDVLEQSLELGGGKRGEMGVLIEEVEKLSLAGKQAGIGGLRLFSNDYLIARAGFSIEFEARAAAALCRACKARYADSSMPIG